MAKRLSPIPSMESFLGQRHIYDLTDSYETGSLLVFIRFTSWKRATMRELLKPFVEEDYELGEGLNMAPLATLDGNPRIQKVIHADTGESGDGKEVTVTYQFYRVLNTDEPVADFISDVIPWLMRASERYQVNIEASYTYVDKPKNPVSFGYWEMVRRSGVMQLRQGHVPAD